MMKRTMKDSMVMYITMVARCSALAMTWPFCCLFSLSISRLHRRSFMYEIELNYNLFTDFMLCLRCNHLLLAGMSVPYCHQTSGNSIYGLWKYSLFNASSLFCHVKTCITEQCLHTKHIKICFAYEIHFLSILENRLFSPNHAHYWALSERS